jgi:hypothetical protein
MILLIPTGLSKLIFAKVSPRTTLPAFPDRHEITRESQKRIEKSPEGFESII